MLVRVTGFTAELDRAKLGSNSDHTSMADELDCASEELREFGDWSGFKEIHVDDGDEPEEDRVNEAVTDEFNIAYLTVDHIDYDVIEPDDNYYEVDFPEWAVCVLVHGDPSSLTSKDVVDYIGWRDGMLAKGYDVLSPNVTEDRNEFCANPAFGLATSTVKVRFRKRKDKDNEGSGKNEEYRDGQA